MLQLLKKKAAEFTENHKEEINILEGPGIGSLIQNVGWLNILYFAIQDFPTLTAMYGPEWAEHLEKRIRSVITKEGKKNLNHSDFHLFSFNAGEFFLLDPTDNMKNSSLQKLAYKFKVKTENKLKSEQIVRTRQQCDHQ